MNVSGKRIILYLCVWLLSVAAAGLLLDTFQQHQVAVVAAALSPTAQAGTWTTFASTGGLPTDEVSAVAVDDAGDVWVGVKNGEWGYTETVPTNEVIARWNGDTWTTYSIPGCDALSLAADAWVYAGTVCWGPPTGAGGGLHWFVDDTWVHFTPADGMAGNYVHMIVPEGGTKVWLIADYVSRWDPTYANLLDHKGTVAKADDEWTVYQVTSQGYACLIGALAIDPLGNCWFGSPFCSLQSLSRNGEVWTDYPYVKPNVTDIAFDAVGNTWLAHGTSSGVTRLRWPTWTHYETREEAIEANYATIHTTQVGQRDDTAFIPRLWVAERQAGVWISQREEGVKFYNGSSWRNYTQGNSGLSSNWVTDIAVDEQGNVWFVSRGMGEGASGLDRFTPDPDFQLVATPSSLLVEPGETAVASLQAQMQRGWLPAVTVTHAGLPANSSATFSHNPITPTLQTRLTITTTPNTPLDTYPVTITGTAKGLTRTVNINVRVVSDVHRLYLPLILEHIGPNLWDS